MIWNLYHSLWCQWPSKNKINILLITTLFWYHPFNVMYITNRDLFRYLCLFDVIRSICISLVASCSIYNFFMGYIFVWFVPLQGLLGNNQSLFNNLFLDITLLRVSFFYFLFFMFFLVFSSFEELNILSR